MDPNCLILFLIIAFLFFLEVRNIPSTHPPSSIVGGERGGRAPYHHGPGTSCQFQRTYIFIGHYLPRFGSICVTFKNTKENKLERNKFPLWCRGEQQGPWLSLEPYKEQILTSMRRHSSDYLAFTLHKQSLQSFFFFFFFFLFSSTGDTQRHDRTWARRNDSPKSEASIQGMLLFPAYVQAEGSWAYGRNQTGVWTLLKEWKHEHRRPTRVSRWVPKWTKRHERERTGHFR